MPKTSASPWADRDSARFASEPDTGSRTGKPNGCRLILEADWTAFGNKHYWAAP